MEFRKMVTITLYARQQKRHRCIAQSFGLCGRGRGWDDLGERHWNMNNICNESPVQVRCMILDAWGWCTGTTQRDGMGREVGGGFRMGNTCIPVADSFWYMAKPIQYCKVKKLKIKKRKRHLFCVLVLEGLVNLHRTVQLQLLQHYWWGHRLGLL